MAVRLFVGNLPYSATEAALRELFSTIAPLSYIYLPIDRERASHAALRLWNLPSGLRPKKPFGSSTTSSSWADRLPSTRLASARIARRPGSPSRPPALGRPPAAEQTGTTERGGRSFGPDAAPRRTFRKPGARGGKASDRAPKQPIRERPGGRFFGEDADESIEDDFSGDNFASRVDDADDE